MKTGEVIRTYRKHKNMTQEEMAGYLGVTAPAVNKWENGNSMPDIMLLAPIARLLDISLETLLCYHEELTDQEVDGLLREAYTRLHTEDFGTVFQWAKKLIEKYPNCERFILWMAQLLDTQRSTMDEDKNRNYDEYISSCFTRILHSQDEDLRSSAADALYIFHLRNKEYEKAEEYLKFISKYNPERKQKQALIYSRTDRIDEAYKTYEELLYSSYQIASMVFQSLAALAMSQQDLAKAHIYADKQGQLAALFEMGKYYEVTGQLEIAVAEKDIGKTLDVMEQLLGNVDEISAFTRSPLYEHLSFSSIREGFLEQLKRDLLNGFRDDEAFGFLKNEERWHEMIK